MARTKAFDETEVLQKAVDLFHSKGYNGASAQELVDALGISRSSLYDTFGDKRNLFIKALQHYRTTASQRMVEAVEKSTDIEATVREIFTLAVKESLEDCQAKGCFMVNTAVELAPHDPEVAAIVRQNTADVEKALLKAVLKGQAEGVFTKSRPALSLARFLYNNVVGLRVAAKAGTDKKTYDDVVSVALAALKA